MSVKVLKRKHLQIENGLEMHRCIQIEARKVIPFSQTDTEKANLLRCHRQEKKKKKKKKKKAVDQQATGIHFQEEIIVEILDRLPVQSLLRFKCVSKNWESLISDPGFKMKHRSPDSKLLIRKKKRYRIQGDIIKFNFYSSSLSTFEDVRVVDPPLSYNVDHYELFSSFDGLVLLKADTELLLWNPSTRESVLLPHSDFKVGYSSFGLGYDDATGDGYKILKVNTGPIQLTQSFEILTLKSGSWRKICNYPTGVCTRTGCKREIRIYPNKIAPNDPLVCVHGAFHWLADYKAGGKLYLVSFDISNEVFGDVPLLEEMCVGIYSQPDIGLSLLDGMLCFHITTSYYSLGTFKLWGMKDYGVKESWILLFTIQIDGLDVAKARYMFPDGDVLLYSRDFSHQFGAPNPFTFQTSKGKFGFWPRHGSFEKGIVYRESLISPKLLI